MFIGEFIKFLKKHKALETFEKAVQKVGWKNAEEFLRETPVHTWLTRFCAWENTPEGREFWLNLYTEWAKESRKIYEVQMDRYKFKRFYITRALLMPIDNWGAFEDRIADTKYSSFVSNYDERTYEVYFEPDGIELPKEECYKRISELVEGNLTPEEVAELDKSGLVDCLHCYPE